MAAAAVLLVLTLTVGRQTTVQSEGEGVAKARPLISEPVGSASGVSVPPFDLAAVGAQLATGEPFVITVVGDETGNGASGWVYQMASRITKGYGRPVTVHDWSSTANQYTGIKKFPGKGETVTIWNASASGKGPAYSIAYWNQIAPVNSNVFVLSHGQQVSVARALPDMKQLYAAAKSRIVAGGGVAVVLPNPRFDSPDRAEQLGEIAQQLREWFANPQNNTGAAVVDIYEKFEQSTNARQLVDASNGYRPSERGSRLWVDSMCAGMGVP